MTAIHQAGFVNIVGKPNVGKSTFMNAVVGEKLSIITSKAQTTRHRILGILNGENFQIIYSDTPGIIKPAYELHNRMMQFVEMSLEDADILLWIVEVNDEVDTDILQKIKRVEAPVFLLINKIDLVEPAIVQEKIAYWEAIHSFSKILPISALKKTNIQEVFDIILKALPEHPAYYEKDYMTDKPERFFAAEAIREKIFLNLQQEIPYCCEVIINSFKEEETIIRIQADILVERDSQKGIVIGRKGETLKKIGSQARQSIEAFFGKQVFLEQFVKVEPDWRNKKNMLEKLGY